MDSIDDFTVRFRLVQPLASFPEKLRIGIAPAHALEGAPIAQLDQHPFNLSPIGTGPYQIESLLTEDGDITGISLRAAPNFQQRPEGAPGFTLDRIVFTTYPTEEDAINALLEGEVNAYGGFPADRVEDLSALTHLSVQTTIAPQVGMLLFNWQRDELAYFRQFSFREALTLGTDRRGAVLNALPGRAVPAESPFLPGSWAHNPDAVYPQPNREAAQAMMEGVSFDPPTLEEGEEGEEPVATRRNFSILTLNDPIIAGVAFELATQWEALGLQVDLEQVDAATLQTRLDAGDFDTALVEFDLNADPDQFTLWHEGQVEDGQNYGGVSDPLISNLLVAARRDNNGVHRKELYDEFQTVFISRAPALVLYHPLYLYVVDSRLQGVQLNFMGDPSDRFNTLRDWFFPPQN